MKFLKKLTKRFIRSNNVGTREAFDEEYLFDFKSGYLLPRNNINDGFVTIGGATGLSNVTITTDSAGMTQVMPITPQDIKEAKKKEVKPIDVVDELETVPNPISILNLDKKIKILKNKTDLVEQTHTKRELNALVDRLTNRKKYVKHKKFFDQFKNTTDDKINKLVTTYDLVMKTADIFIPEFPDIAVEIMTEYTKNTKKICGKKPIYYVIAPESAFKKSFEKRDPILLVQSPFGFYYQILGAWDKEMLLLSEL